MNCTNCKKVLKDSYNTRFETSEGAKLITNCCSDGCLSKAMKKTIKLTPRAIKKQRRAMRHKIALNASCAILALSVIALAVWQFLEIIK